MIFAHTEHGNDHNTTAPADPELATIWNSVVKFDYPGVEQIYLAPIGADLLVSASHRGPGVGKVGTTINGDTVTVVTHYFPSEIAGDIAFIRVTPALSTFFPRLRNEVVNPNNNLFMIGGGMGRGNPIYGEDGKQTGFEVAVAGEFQEKRWGISKANYVDKVAKLIPGSIGGASTGAAVSCYFYRGHPEAFGARPLDSASPIFIDAGSGVNKWLVAGVAVGGTTGVWHRYGKTQRSYGVAGTIVCPFNDFADSLL